MYMNGNFAPEYPIHVKSEQTTNYFPTPVAAHLPFFSLVKHHFNYTQAAE